MIDYKKFSERDLAVKMTKYIENAKSLLDEMRMYLDSCYFFEQGA